MMTRSVFGSLFVLLFRVAAGLIFRGAGGAGAGRRHSAHARRQPFLILGGELGNSTASSPDILAAVWPSLAALHVNTVLVPACWELLEPAEGTFDLSSVARVVDQARQHGMHVVSLWFGSWKRPP
jgi:hypothetical protein